MADHSYQTAEALDAEHAYPPSNLEHHVVFLFDVDALAGFVRSIVSPNMEHDYCLPQAAVDIPSQREGDGGFSPDRLAEVLTRISQVCTQLHGLPTAVSYHMISTKSKFTQERTDLLRSKISSNTTRTEFGAGLQVAGGASGGVKGAELRTPASVHAEMFALIRALSEPEASSQGPNSSTWLENITYHIQQSTSRFIVAMNAAATNRGNHVKAATFVLVTPAPQTGRKVKAMEPLNPELLAALRKVNARFMWLDPSGGADVTHKHQMEAAVEMAARSVAEEHLNVNPAGGEPEAQLALMLSSHWRLDGAPAECMAPQRGLLLPLLPVAWVPVADIFHSNDVLKTLVRRMVSLSPPHPYIPMPASFILSEYRGYIMQFKGPDRWSYAVWSETTKLTVNTYLSGITANRHLRLPPLRMRAEAHKAAAKAAPAAAMKGAWAKRGAQQSGQQPHARPPMAPPAPVAGAALRPGAGGVPGRPGPLTASAQASVLAGTSARQPLKTHGLTTKPGGLPGGRLALGSTGPGGMSRSQKGQQKASKPPTRLPASDPAAAAAANNYTLGRAAGKRIAQALEQGALMAAGLPNTTSKQANDSQNAVAAGGAATGTLVGGAGGGTVSRWVWPPLSSEELAVQTAREGGMVAVDDEMDVGEVLRLADERMHEFIAGDLAAAIRTDEKQLRRAQQGVENEQPPNTRAGVGVQQQVTASHATALQDANSRSAKRQRIAPLESLQPILGNARSRLRSKLLVAPTKLSRHEERLLGWHPPVELVLGTARQHTREVVDSLLRASERAVSTAMRSVRKQAVERRARAREPNSSDPGVACEQCGEVDPELDEHTVQATDGSRKRTPGAGRLLTPADVKDNDGIYAAAIDQVFALLQEAWTGDIMAVLRERGVVRGRPRLQLCALIYSASRVIYAVEMLGYRRRSPRALVEMLREQLDWAVPLLCYVDEAPSMAAFVSECMKPAWADSWAATLLDLLSVSYAGEDREGINEMEFVARWDSDEDWEAGMEEAGGVEAATDALEELQRAATVAAAATQQQGSQPGVSEPRVSGRGTSVSHGKFGATWNASGSGLTGAGGRMIRQPSCHGRPVGGSAANTGTGVVAGVAAGAAAKASKAAALQPQVMEVDSLRGVVIAGSQRPAGVGRMAKHVARLDPVRPTHMMPAIIARPIIHVVPDPPPEKLAVLREEYRLKQRCGAAAANLADLFDKEAPTPTTAGMEVLQAKVETAGTSGGRAVAPQAAPLAAALPLRAPQVRSFDRAPVGIDAADSGMATRGVVQHHGSGRLDHEPPSASESSTEFGPTPMDDGGGRHRSRLLRLDGDGGGANSARGGGAGGLARGLFTDMDMSEAAAINFIPGGEGVFSQVATFQIVKKAVQETVPASGVLHAAQIPLQHTAAQQHPQAAAPNGLFNFGAGIAEPFNMPAAEPQPAPCPSSTDGELRAAAVDAMPLDGDDALNAARCSAGAGDEADAMDMEYGIDSGTSPNVGPPSGCRLQAEEHSVDSLRCRRHDDDDDSDSSSEFGNNRALRAAGAGPPREPIPDACSPCKFTVTTRRAVVAVAGSSRIPTGVGGGGSSRALVSTSNASTVLPRSRRAPPAAAAAAAAAAIGPGAKRGLASGLGKAPPPRLSAAEVDKKRPGPSGKAPPGPGGVPQSHTQQPNGHHPAEPTVLGGAATNRPLAIDNMGRFASSVRVSTSDRPVPGKTGGGPVHRCSKDSDAGAPAGAGDSDAAATQLATAVVMKEPAGAGTLFVQPIPLLIDAMDVDISAEQPQPAPPRACALLDALAPPLYPSTTLTGTSAAATSVMTSPHDAAPAAATVNGSQPIPTLPASTLRVAPVASIPNGTLQGRGASGVSTSCIPGTQMVQSPKVCPPQRTGAHGNLTPYPRGHTSCGNGSAGLAPEGNIGLPQGEPPPLSMEEAGRESAGDVQIVALMREAEQLVEVPKGAPVAGRAAVLDESKPCAVSEAAKQARVGAAAQAPAASCCMLHGDEVQEEQQQEQGQIPSPTTALMLERRVRRHLKHTSRRRAMLFDDFQFGEAMATESVQNPPGISSCADAAANEATAAVEAMVLTKPQGMNPVGADEAAEVADLANRLSLRPSLGSAPEDAADPPGMPRYGQASAALVVHAQPNEFKVDYGAENTQETATAAACGAEAPPVEPWYAFTWGKEGGGWCVGPSEAAKLRRQSSKGTTPTTGRRATPSASKVAPVTACKGVTSGADATASCHDSARKRPPVTRSVDLRTASTPRMLAQRSLTSATARGGPSTQSGKRSVASALKQSQQRWPQVQEKQLQAGAEVDVINDEAACAAAADGPGSAPTSTTASGVLTAATLSRRDGGIMHLKHRRKDDAAPFFDERSERQHLREGGLRLKAGGACMVDAALQMDVLGIEGSGRCSADTISTISMQGRGVGVINLAAGATAKAAAAYDTAADEGEAQGALMGAEEENADGAGRRPVPSDGPGAAVCEIPPSQAHTLVSPDYPQVQQDSVGSAGKSGPMSDGDAAGGEANLHHNGTEASQRQATIEGCVPRGDGGGSGDETERDDVWAPAASSQQRKDGQLGVACMDGKVQRYQEQIVDVRRSCRLPLVKSPPAAAVATTLATRVTRSQARVGSETVLATVSGVSTRGATRREPATVSEVSPSTKRLQGGKRSETSQRTEGEGEGAGQGDRPTKRMRR